MKDHCTFVCPDSDEPSSEICNQIFHLLQDDPLEETGWKLVHGDVFRPPRYPSMLVVCLGSGIQILSMVLIVVGECGSG